LRYCGLLFDYLLLGLLPLVFGENI
jgi:hypothetical protein